MMGITSLPGAQQNPGQAAPASALPAPQPKTPQAMTGQLQSLSPQQLMAMFANPADSTPKWAVVTAYAKAIEQQRLMQAAAGQAAMQQGQMQAGQPPVAMQVLAQGAEPQFSGGGAVSFQTGGPTTGFAPAYTAMRAAGIDLSPYDSPEVRADKFRRFEEYKRTGVVPPPARQEPEERLPGASPEEVSGQSVAPKGLGSLGAINPFNVARMMAPWAAGILPESPKGLKEKIFGDRPSYYAEELYGKPRDKNAVVPGVAPSTLTAPAGVASLPGAELNTPAAPAGIKTPSGAKTSATQSRTTPTTAALGISPTLNPELETAFKARATQLEASKNLPPEVLEARKGLAALEAANIEAQQAGVKGLREESEAALEAARKARGASRLDDIQYIGQMLEGMRGAKRLGEGLAGAAAGAGRAEAGRAAALKEAEKLRREDQRLIRAEEAAGRQLQILAQQRVVAERQGEVDRVAKIDAEISQVKLDLARAKQAQAEKAAEFGLKQTDTESRRITAEAAKAGVAARQGAAGDDPRKVYDTIVDNVEKSYGIWLKSVEGVRATPEQKAAKQQTLLQQQVQLAKAAGVKGLEPLLAATAPPAPSGNDPLGIRKP